MFVSSWQHCDKGRLATVRSHERSIRVSSPDNTVGSLTEFLGDCVSLIDNKVLVKDLEDLSSL